MKNFIDYTSKDVTLEDLTFSALHHFESQPFALMVEASKVDYGSHQNNITMMAGEMIEADRLVRKLIKYIDEHPEKNIQLIVCADHETGAFALTNDFTNLTTEIPRELDPIETQN